MSEAALHILFHNNTSSVLIQAENAVESFCIMPFYTHILILLLGRRKWPNPHINNVRMCFVAYKPLTFICAAESNLFPSLSHAQSDSDGNLILNSWKISWFLHSSQSKSVMLRGVRQISKIRLNPFNLFSVLRK